MTDALEPNPAAEGLSDEVLAEPSLFDKVGGMAFFESLVDRFYEGVATDEVLAPLYPEFPDFSGARHRLTLFLAQYWGGPMSYNAERGQPQLRLRHFPFAIGPLQRDRWLLHMSNAVAAVGAVDSVRTALTDYFRSTAEHLRNDTGLPITSASYQR